MLTLTTNATDVIKALVGGDEAPAGAGLRITQADPQQGPDLAIATAPGPEADDQVVEEQGARVFVGSHAADSLDDKVLDAAVDAEGTVQFTLGHQADLPGGNTGDGPR